MRLSCIVLRRIGILILRRIIVRYVISTRRKLILGYKLVLWSRSNILLRYENRLILNRQGRFRRKRILLRFRSIFDDIPYPLLTKIDKHKKSSTKSNNIVKHNSSNGKIVASLMI